MTTLDSNVNSRSIEETFAEGQRYFMGQGSLNNALTRLAADLKAHGIDYAVIGAVALLAHGYPRFTEDIDLILTPEGLEKFHREVLGLGGYGLAGYTRAFPGSRKRFRSFPEGVSIDVITTGEFPGDGKPKPVSMPEPSMASIEIEGVQFVTLEKLVELKLASGMTATDRLKDLADVQELIKIRGLPLEFAKQLDPYVRKKFLELHEAVKQSPKDQE
jgi:nucleotidyltransferase AbiEii toxin of type IV toxin-antitoxin system